jgi:hypothetical protein
MSVFCSSEMLGSVTGMKSRIAFIEGRHELGCRSAFRDEHAPASTVVAASIVTPRWVSAHSSVGR